MPLQPGSATSAPFDVVIVTPTYISSNPRVVKEADALSGAGFRVAVVFSQGQTMWARADDEAVSADRAWPAYPVSWSRTEPAERRRYVWSTLRFHLARRTPFSAVGPFWLVKRAECRTYPELAGAAAAVPARLYVGHYPEGLAAAAAAAVQHAAHLAYDAEDLHVEEEPPSPASRRRRRRVERIERTHVPRCVYVSAASQGVARALAERYGVVSPVVVHNAFGWSDRKTIDGLIRDRRGDAVSLYWYSQVIGMDRGLPDVMRALGEVKADFQLHIRGYCTDAVARQLRGLAESAGFGGRLFLHARVAPAELLSRTAEHDIGLALEQPISVNRALTAANKLFFYLLAGLAVVATATPGQQAVLDEAPGAADTYPPGNHTALARILDRLLADRSLLARRREAALSAARTRWNWEMEQRPLIAAVRGTLAG